MCMMCGDIHRAVHWSDVEAAFGEGSSPLEQESWRRRMRAARAELLSELLKPVRVRVSDDWGSGLFLVTDSTGRSVLAKDLEEVWEALRGWGVPLPDPVAGMGVFGEKRP